MTLRDARNACCSLPVARVPNILPSLGPAQVPRQSFAYTGQIMRAMEAAAVAISQREPLLLVGETGTGKTTLVQQIAHQVSDRPWLEVHISCCVARLVGTL